MRSLQLSLEECLASESDLADSVDLQTFSSLQLCSFDIENGRHKLVSAVRLKFWIQFLEQFWDPLDSTVGSSFGLNLGVHFWAPFSVPNFGTQLWIHFWDPIFCQFLGPVFDQKYEFWGPVFGTKFGSVFGVQNLDSLIFLIGDHFLVPIFGVQIWTKIWPPKLTKNVKKFPDRVCPEGEPVWHTEMLRKLSDLAHENNQIFPNRLHIWFPNRAKHDFESGPIICANLTYRREADLAPQKGFVLQLTRGCTFGVRGYPNIQNLRGSRSGTQVRNNSWRWVVFSL